MIITIQSPYSDGYNYQITSIWGYLAIVRVDEGQGPMQQIEKVKTFRPTCCMCLQEMLEVQQI